jgi:competence protein ComEC
MGGVITGLYLPPVPGLSWVLFGLCLFSLLANRSSRYHLLLLFFILGCWSLQGTARPDLPSNHIDNFIDGKHWHIIGTVLATPQGSVDRTRFSVRAESLTRGQKTHVVTGGIRITVQGQIEGIDKGDRIACLAKLKRLWNFNNPGGFNYKRHMAFRGVRASAFVSRPELVIRLHAGARGWFSNVFERARKTISALLEKLPLQDARAVLKALIIGDRSDISQQTKNTLRRIGGAHLLAISGLHIGMIATLAFFFFRLLLTFSERILLAAWRNRGAAILSALPVLFYGLLAGMSPSTQRAVIMTMAFLAAQLLDREQDTMNTLAAAALVILAFNPTSLFDVSFQLSFAAVFSILYALTNLPFVTTLKNPPYRILKRLGLLLLISTAATLGTLPITLYYFNQTSLIGPVTNCILVPLVAVLVVPLGLLAAVSLCLSDVLSLFLMKGALLAMQGGLALADQFSRLSFAAVKVVTPSFLEIGLYYICMWALFRFRKTKRAKIVLFAIGLIVLADVAYWSHKRYYQKNLTVTVLDVGQGQAVLVELPGGECVLVDGGGFYENRFDVGERIVAPFLWRKKIATVETVVLSHPHPDHLNGLMFVARHFDVQSLWTNQDVNPSSQYQELLDTVSKKGIEVLGPDELASAKTIGGVDFQILYPPVDFLKRKTNDPWRTTNNNSLVIKVTWGNVSFLLPGDIEARGERELVSLAGKALNSDVLIVPHHGSKTSSTEEFLRFVDPAVAVISAGRNSPPGLPHKDVLKRYRTRGCRILRTDLQGAITLITDGSKITVKPYLR